MAYVYLTDMERRLRRAGLRLGVLPGWQTRGRPPSTGDFDPGGVLIHHTGSSQDGAAYAKWLGTVGRSDLPAPLCQVSIGRDGTVYLLAAGRANHAGKAKASGPMPAGDGNALYVGIECHNTGSEGWTEPQYAATVRTAAVLCRMLGARAEAVRGHRETSVTGKVDPGRMDMGEFRDDVADEIARMRRVPLPSVRRILRRRLAEAVAKGDAPRVAWLRGLLAAVRRGPG